MKDWYSYLTPEFAFKKKNIKTRDRVVVSCPRCGRTDVVQVSNLKSKVKKRGNYVCFSCAAREATLKSRSKYLKTMKEKYGVENPNQVPEFKKKIKKTNQERYGKGGSLKKARKAFKDKYKLDNPFSLKKLRDDKARGFDYSEITVSYQEDKKEWRRQYKSVREKYDFSFKMKNILRNAVTRMVRRVKNKKLKVTKIIDNIGFTEEEFKTHIESKFKPGMNWENHGLWHIDHIKPISKFNLKSKKERALVNSLNNLQPLWAKENIKKSNS